MICISGYAQNFPLKKPRENVVWIDSLKRILKKDFVIDSYQKNNWKKQLEYTNSCVLLAMYYEWAYDKHYIKNMSQALFYYKKVIDFGRYPDDEKYFKSLAIRTNIFRKLADIYFKGKGVKKDKNYSLELALGGVGNTGELYKFYSLRYFNSTNIILENFYDASTYKLKFNPFVAKSVISKFKFVDTYLDTISNAFKTKSLNDSLEIFIQCYSRPSVREQISSDNIASNIRNYFLQKCKINSDLVISNIEVSDKVGLEIIIQRKGTF